MAVTKHSARLFVRLFIYLGLAASSTSWAAILPEDRADIMYHRYEGGGLIIDGPSVLIRKSIKDKVSVWGNYYTDSISGASVDILAQGSTYYEEHREQKSLGLDYLHNRTTISLSATNSHERDYTADNVAFAVSQDFFGDMTTLSLNYSQGNDEVRQNIYEDGRIINTVYRGDKRSQRFGLGLTQVLTRRWIVALSSESVIDDGFLNNPYRVVRFVTPEGNESVQPEVYPETRNSDAFAIRSMYYLPFKSALKLEYRIFSDSWGIEASNYEFRYIHPIGERLIVEARHRGYSQTQADFYSDLFPFENAQSFLARDKEMSAFSNSLFGLGATYTIKSKFLNWFDETTVNFYWDNMSFDYENFRDRTKGSDAGLGNEPLYQLDANIFRLFFSFKY